eukprot:CCRYP_003930-RB/>CCRYP_003930-RB protein AED:0.10 eAED:0.10 QI:268/1/1/1/0/0/5/732/192
MTRKLANGICCFGPATFVSAAFILSQFGSKGCEFLSFGNSDDIATYFNKNQVTGAGFYCYHTLSGIDYYYSDNLAFSDQVAFVQRMGIATTVLGATAWGFYIIASCIRFPPPIWLFVSMLLTATCVCEGLCFRFFDAPVCNITECSLGKSSKCSLSACVFWGLSSFMTCAVFKDAQDRDNEENEQQEVGDGD